MEKKGRLNKYEVSYLYLTTLQAGLPALTGVSSEKLRCNSFGTSPDFLKRIGKKDLVLTHDENERLRFVQKIVHHLRGSYNPEGIRGWFLRYRLELDGKRPVDILKGKEWQPGEAMLQKVLKLAEAVSGPYRGT